MAAILPDAPYGTMAAPSARVRAVDVTPPEVTMAGPQDDWNDDDHYPMHPSHPGWDTQRDPTVERIRSKLPWLWVVLGAAVGVALFLRWLWGS